MGLSPVAEKKFLSTIGVDELLMVEPELENQQYENEQHEIQQHESNSHRWPFVKKVALMCLSLLAGMACALGHHVFYDHLDGTTPPSKYYTVWGFPHGISKQQLNISAGNTLAFLTKAFLAVAVASAHDQINWRAIKRRPTQLGLIDSLFSSRDDLPSALNIRMWWHLPVPAVFLLMFWLLPLAPLITPSTLTIQAALVSSKASMRTPRVDFTSMNFAQISWTFSDITRALNDKEWQQFVMTYEKPQFPVQKSVQGSLFSGDIVPISAPGSNSTWTLDFYGPALSCSALDNASGVGNDTITQLASQLDGVRYLSWVPYPGNGSSVPAGISSDLRSVTVGGSPLAVYVMIPPPISYNTIQNEPNPPAGESILNQSSWSAAYNETLAEYYQAKINYYKSYTYLQECTLQNVSYNANFTYTNGLQNITLDTSRPLNNVSYLTGYTSFAEISANASGFFPYDPNFTTVTLNSTGVQNLAYQSVMDSFASVLVGYVEAVSSQIDDKSSMQYTVDTYMGTTALVQGREMANVTQSLALQFELLGNVLWDGKSVNQNDTGSKPLTNLMEEMFRNATISLMSNSALNPNYESLYAPSNATVETWIAENFYQYEAGTLWVTYGIAIGIAALSVLAGAFVVVSQRAAYSTRFSTLIRVAHNIYLPIRIAPEDTGGKDPLPPYMSDVVVQFPPEGAAAVGEDKRF